MKHDEEQENCEARPSDAKVWEDCLFSLLPTGTGITKAQVIKCCEMADVALAEYRARFPPKASEDGLITQKEN